MCASNGLRQIITHAAVARGQKHFTQTFALRPNYRPGNILGTRLTGQHFSAETTDEGVRVNGSFVLHIWYDHERGTQTDNIDQEVHCQFIVPTNALDGERLHRNEFAELDLLHEPHIVRARIRGDYLDVTVELEVRVEVFGDCKLWIKTYQPDAVEEKDDDDIWDDGEGLGGDDYVDDEDDDEDDDDDAYDDFFHPHGYGNREHQ